MTDPVEIALLHEALNLVVRARKMDAIDRRANMLATSCNPEAWQADGLFDKFVAQYNLEPQNAHAPIESRSLTQQLWVIDQYEKDLFDWEQRARKFLTDHVNGLSVRAVLQEKRP